MLKFKTILAFYWLVFLNFCVFVCQGSWILDISGGFLNDDGEREEGSKASINSPFCSISLTIASQLEGSLPLLPLLWFVLYPWDGNDHYKIEMEKIASHCMRFLIKPCFMQEIRSCGLIVAVVGYRTQLMMTFQYSSRRTQL